MSTDQSQTTAPTQLSTSPSEPLTDEQVLATYGPLMWDAMVAFSQDPYYFSEMAHAGGLVVYKRELWSARKEAAKRGVPHDQVQEAASKILAERGIHQPPVRLRNR